MWPARIRAKPDAVKEDADKSFEAFVETLALDEETLQLGHGETIVPQGLTTAPDATDALATLPRLGTGQAPATNTVDLELLGTLGEGGMGLVRLARQVALGRDVAVKTLRTQSDAAAPKLLQEAYVTGRLEHPNIVPIYTLGQDDDGAPLIVMKRIDGVSWLDVLRDPATAPGDADPDLLWHLEVLQHLCNAVRYAHRHDVIHRDIKPENVMIGLFGEVYLLDWGIAVSIAEVPDGSVALPHRDDVVGMSGTPAYMAPEMTHDRATEHDERTDIYLLGALLHEILTGRPRHSGESLFDVLRSAFENKPVEYPEDVPAELGVIANRAMATEKADRFQTVEEFRAAVSNFIEHRGALELISQADQLLEQIAEIDEEQGGAEDSIAMQEHAFAVHDLFIECRFACQQALRSWPDSEPANAVFDRYLFSRFQHAIGQRDVVQARSVLAQMEERGVSTDVHSALLESLLADRESEEEELRGLRALASELDLSRGRISRSLAVMLMGVAWSLDTLQAWVFRLGQEHVDVSAAYVGGVWRVAAIGIVALFLFRKSFFSTTANRRLAYLLVFVITSIVTYRVIYVMQPDPLLAVRATEVAMYGMAGTSAGMLADDLRITAFGALYFPMALLTAAIGPQSTIGLAIVHLIVFVGAGWCWTPRQLKRRIRV